MSKDKLPEWLRASVQRALLGEITPNMRLIAGSISGNSSFVLRYYFDNEPTEEDLENVSTIGANVDASLGTKTFGSMIDECLYSSEPFGALDTLDGVFYARKEG